MKAVNVTQLESDTILVCYDGKALSLCCIYCTLFNVISRLWHYTATVVCYLKTWWERCDSTAISSQVESRRQNFTLASPLSLLVSCVSLQFDSVCLIGILFSAHRNNSLLVLAVSVCVVQYVFKTVFLPSTNTACKVAALKATRCCIFVVVWLLWKKLLYYVVFSVVHSIVQCRVLLKTT